MKEIQVNKDVFDKSIKDKKESEKREKSMETPSDQLVKRESFDLFK